MQPDLNSRFCNRKCEENLFKPLAAPRESNLISHQISLNSFQSPCLLIDHEIGTGFPPGNTLAFKEKPFNSVFLIAVRFCVYLGIIVRAHSGEQGLQLVSSVLEKELRLRVSRAGFPLQMNATFILDLI